MDFKTLVEALEGNRVPLYEAFDLNLNGETVKGNAITVYPQVKTLPGDNNRLVVKVAVTIAITSPIKTIVRYFASLPSTEEELIRNLVKDLGSDPDICLAGNFDMKISQKNSHLLLNGPFEVSESLEVFQDKVVKKKPYLSGKTISYGETDVPFVYAVLNGNVLPGISTEPHEIVKLIGGKFQPRTVSPEEYLQALCNKNLFNFASPKQAEARAAEWLAGLEGMMEVNQKDYWTVMSEYLPREKSKVAVPQIGINLRKG
jgi:hypothetical protein